MEETIKNLTEVQKEIFKACLEGDSIWKIGIERAKSNLFIMEGEESYLNEHRTISEERAKDFAQVERYLNSFEDYETRKKALIKKADEQYKEFQDDIDKFIEQGMNSEDIWKIIIPNEYNFLEYLAIEFGFSDHELVKIINNKLNFHD